MARASRRAAKIRKEMVKEKERRAKARGNEQLRRFLKVVSNRKSIRMSGQRLEKQKTAVVYQCW